MSQETDQEQRIRNGMLYKAPLTDAELKTAAASFPPWAVNLGIGLLLFILLVLGLAVFLAT